MSKNTVSNFNLRMTVYCALFTALIIIGGYISIPIPVGPVPIVLADFFVMITGLFLGLKYGLISTALYLALGALGMPVFAGGGAGLAVLVGPEPAGSSSAICSWSLLLGSSQARENHPSLQT